MWGWVVLLARSDSSGPASADGSQDDFAADVRELDPSSPVFGKLHFILLYFEDNI